jgi:hypothetical protein
MSNALTDLANSLAPYLAHTDSAAIHDDVAGEITAITLKAAPAIDDVFIIEDAADSEEKKSVTLGAMFKAAGQVSNLDAAVPLITDKFAFEDQSDSDIMKEATIQEIMAAPGWVTGLAAKAAPTVADKIAIEDAADSAAMKESTIQQVMAAVAWIDGLTAKATPIGADLVAISDSAAAGATKKATINTLPILQAQVSSILLTPAADAEVALLATTAAVQLTVTAGATVVISTDPGCYAGQDVDLFAISVAGGGAYTLALNTGTLTINATSECARVKRNTGNTAWYVVQMTGATIV